MGSSSFALSSFSLVCLAFRRRKNIKAPSPINPTAARLPITEPAIVPPDVCDDEEEDVWESEVFELDGK
jgi:hypothetical protein